MMKRIFTFSLLMLAFAMNAVAQDKTTMVEVHDFAGFSNGASITWGQQSGDDLNSDWDRVTLESINGKEFYSWVDGKPRFSLGRASDWQWNNGWVMTHQNNKTFYINRLDAGDKIIIEYGTSQTLLMASGNTSLSLGTQITSGQAFTVNSAGGVAIECPQNVVIYKVTIATKHLATYVIDHQTYTFTSGGVLPDKRKAVPYMTMSFGNEGMDFAYVRYYGKENGVKQFGSFILTETMEDEGFYFTRPNSDINYYTEPDNNYQYVLSEPVVFKGYDFDEYVPWHGTYYYFYPETNGRLYVHWHSDPVTKQLDDQSWKHDVIFLWDKTTNDIGNSYSVEYDEESYEPRTTTMSPPFYKFAQSTGTNPLEDGVRVLKNHAYFMCISPLDVRRKNVAHLLDYTFIPDFTMTPLYKVIEPGYEPQTSGEIEVSELMYTDHMDPATLHYRVKKCLGNIESATVKIENNKLYFTSITYKSGNVNKGGAVIVDVDCTDGQADFVLTVPYSAEPIDGTGREVKKWDFYSNIIDNATVDYNNVDNTGKPYKPFVDADAPMMGKVHLGQYKTSGSGLQYETDKEPGEWLNTYIDLDNRVEPIFKNVYDIDGDNADMIWDTNGLIFHAKSTTTCIYNENDESTSEFKDRYLGFMPGSKLVIPRLKANDRVVIKMGSYGNADNTIESKNATLRLTNAKDAVGNPITTDYVIGGSIPYPNETDDAKAQPHGEYHFIVANTSNSDDTDFAIEVADDTELLKIYSIAIYSNSDILTENSVTGDKKGVLFTDQDADGATKTVVSSLRYHGYQETATFEGIDQIRGNLDLGTEDTHKNKYVSETSTTTEPYCKVTTTLNKGDFGSYRAKMAVKTKDANNTYVTDYATGSMAVGYRETKPYPYTWDFTDLKKYAITTGELDNNGTENDDVADMKTWNNYGLRVSTENADGCLFVSGGQLYAGATMFPETKGIGIYHYNNKNQNGVMTITGDGTTESGGLQVNDNSASNESPLAWGFNVPSVKAGQAVYVHAKECGSTHYAKYLVNDPTDNFSFDLEGTDAGYIPLGWICYQGDDTHIYGTHYDLGTRVMTGFKGYQGKGLYWRNGYAAYTGGLYLKPGSYTLKFAMAAWTNTPTYKVDICKSSTPETAIKSSVPYEAAPNAASNSSADLSSTTLRTFTFDITDADNYIIKFSQVNNGWGEFLLLQCDLTTPEHDFEYTATDANGDNIFAMKLPADATDSDVKLCFQGYEVNKIAVATDEKKVNELGWNTESRARAIDPSLLPYMTGKDFRTYIASAISTKDDGEKIVTLTRIDGVSADDDESAAKYVVPAANNKDPYACIIRNAGGAAVDMFGDGSGFHLFVPDMHDAADTENTIWSNNLLKARVTPTTGNDKVLRDEGEKANYAFTNKWKYVDADGKELEGRGGQKVGDQAFYRIMQGGASSDGNQAYLSIADNIYPARLSIVFEGEKGDSEATGIATVEDNSVGGENARFYNLSGQQLSGKPNRSGLYIVNGKKVSIKNK